jgi:hypothetical protein
VKSKSTSHIQIVQDLSNYAVTTLYPSKIAGASRDGLDSCRLSDYITIGLWDNPE